MAPEIKIPVVALDTFGESELVDVDAQAAHILRMRSGMVDGSYHPLRELGEELGLSEERVRQLEDGGLIAIREVREGQRHLRRGPTNRARYRWRTFP